MAAALGHAPLPQLGRQREANGGGPRFPLQPGRWQLPETRVAVSDPQDCSPFPLAARMSLCLVLQVFLTGLALSPNKPTAFVFKAQPL